MNCADYLRLAVGDQLRDRLDPAVCLIVPGMPRRVALLAFLAIAGIVRIGHAAPAVPPRVVAVIDATGDADGAALAMRIGAAVSPADGLAPVADQPAARALFAPLLDEDAAVANDARTSLDQADEALGAFNYATALGAAVAGESRLLAAAPRPATTDLLASLVFTEGMARFPNNPDGTRLAFAEVHRLSPDRALDPARFVPEIMEAYESSGRGDPGTGMLDVQADGPATDAWVDGVKAGPVPSQLALPGGIHFVSVTGDDAVTTGARVRVVPGQDAPLHLTVARADLTTRIARMRRRLLEAPDDAARAAAIAQLARAVGTDAAVVVVRDGDKLATRVWRDAAPGLGPVVAFTDEPRQVLEPLVPPPPPPDDGHPLGPPIKLPPPPPSTPWWKKTWVREVAAIGAIVVVGSVATYAATRDPGTSDLTAIMFHQ